MTHRHNTRDVQQAGETSAAALCVREQGFSACCKLLVVNSPQQGGVGRTRRGGSTQKRHRAALIAAIVCRTCQDRLVSVHLCDSSHRAAPASPRLKRGMTFGLGQKSGNSSALNRCYAGWLVLRNGSTFHGETALRLLLRRMRKALLCL